MVHKLILHESLIMQAPRHHVTSRSRDLICIAFYLQYIISVRSQYSNDTLRTVQHRTEPYRYAAPGASLYDYRAGTNRHESCSVSHSCGFFLSGWCDQAPDLCSRVQTSTEGRIVTTVPYLLLPLAPGILLYYFIRELCRFVEPTPQNLMLAYAGARPGTCISASIQYSTEQ